MTLAFAAPVPCTTNCAAVVLMPLLQFVPGPSNDTLTVIRLLSKGKALLLLAPALM